MGKLMIRAFGSMILFFFFGEGGYSQSFLTRGTRIEYNPAELTVDSTPIVTFHNTTQLYNNGTRVRLLSQENLLRFQSFHSKPAFHWSAGMYYVAFSDDLEMALSVKVAKAIKFGSVQTNWGLGWDLLHSNNWVGDFLPRQKTNALNANFGVSARYLGWAVGFSRFQDPVRVFGNEPVSIFDPGPIGHSFIQYGKTSTYFRHEGTFDIWRDARKVNISPAIAMYAYSLQYALVYRRFFASIGMGSNGLFPLGVGFMGGHVRIQAMFLIYSPIVYWIDNVVYTEQLIQWTPRGGLTSYPVY